jgi:HSP20 family protein
MFEENRGGIMSFLIPNLRRHNDWLYDVDRFFGPFETENKLTISEDVEESENHILMSFDIPGMKQGDFSVKVDDDRLLISGERKREETKTEKRNVVYSRRSYGKFQKAYQLPENVDAKNIEADYRDGVLRVYLPKVTVQKENAFEVKVKAKDSFFDRLLGQTTKSE